MHLRPATLADIPAILAIQRETPTLSQWSRQQYEDVFSPHSNRIAAVMEDETVRAFIVARDIRGEWEIENVAVSGSARRQGLASALLHHTIDVARSRGGRVIFLEVREFNHQARRLYEKHGFVVGGKRARYYVDPVEDAIIYNRPL
jgi:ribosomal-protein-alanine N-acetyltransferase